LEKRASPEYDKSARNNFSGVRHIDADKKVNIPGGKM
jgi:hypothetical protein